MRKLLFSLTMLFIVFFGNAQRTTAPHTIPTRSMDRAVGSEPNVFATQTDCNDSITDFPWEEGFEGDDFPPACWTSYNVDGGGTQWAINYSENDAHTGEGSARHHSASTSFGAQEGWLITPRIDIPLSGFTLEFWSANHYPNQHEYNGIWISTNGNNPSETTFTEIYQLSGDEISSSFKKIIISLDDYAGESIYIGFKYTGTQADAWYIDDVVVQDFDSFSDVQMIAITSPSSGYNLSSDSVTVIVQNNGGTDLFNVNIVLNVDGTVEAIETIASIPALSQTTYTFGHLVDLSAAGDYTITVYTALNGDIFPANDTVTLIIRNIICNAITSLPWTEGFESAVFPPDCWTIYSTDTATWTRNFYAHGHESTHSAVCFSDDNSQERWLVTPRIEIPTEGHVLEFWSSTHFLENHQYNGVWISTTGNDPNSATFTEIYQLNGDDISSPFTRILISLNDYTGDTVYIGFKYTGSDADTWYIDDIKVMDYSDTVDIEVVSITSPTSGINLGYETVTAVVQNNGGITASNISITVNVNGVDEFTEIITDTIAPLSQRTYTFTQPIDLFAEEQSIIKVYTTYSGDQNALNDTATTTITNTTCSPVTTFPWEEQFSDNISVCWTRIDADGDGENWHTTIFNEEPVAASLSLSLTTTYTPDNYLITPEIILNSDYILSFSIGAISNYYPAEKYSVMISTTGLSPADFTTIHTETLTESAMKTVVLPLNNYTGESIYIAFRHWDCTGQSGLLLDNIKISGNILDAEVIDITAPSSGIALGAESVKAIIKNHSTCNIFNFPLTLSVNGTVVATETCTDTITSLTQIEYTFAQTYDFSNLGNYTISVTVNMTGDDTPANNMFTKSITHFSNEAVTLYGYKIHGDEIPGIVVSFSTLDPAVISIVDNYADGSNHITGGEYYGKHLYLFSRSNTDPYAPVNFIKLSTTTWEATTIPVSNICYDMTYDYTTNTMYGLNSIGNSTSDLYTINLTTGALTRVGPLGKRFLTLACNLQGQMYGIDTDGDFHLINKTTASTTVIGNTGISPQYIQSMAFDHTSGRLFWAMTNTLSEGKLIEIDPDNSATFDHGILGANAEMVALYTPYDISTPISVLSLSPTNGAVNVEPTATVSVTFNTGITAVDLSGITITPDPGGVSASISGAVLTIAHDDFDNDTRYTVTVPAGAIEDYATATTWSFTSNNVGISSINLKTINIYPNPAKEQLQLTNLPEKSEINIYDMTGRIIRTYQANDHSISINLDFAPGIYLVKVGSYVEKFIKE